MGSQTQETYLVDTIVAHDTYENVFKNRYDLAFNPPCKESEVHSYYVYLVKWKGYPDSANTWEPEENLDGCAEFYKANHNLPEDERKLIKLFDWDSPVRSASSLSFMHAPSSLSKKGKKNRSSASRSNSRLDLNDSGASSSSTKKIHVAEEMADDDNSELNRKSKKSKLAKSDHEGSSLITPKKVKSKESNAKRKLKVDEKEQRQKLEPSKSIVKPSDGERVPIVRYMRNESARESRSVARELYAKRRWSSLERLPLRWQSAVDEYALDEHARAWAACIHSLIVYTKNKMPPTLTSNSCPIFMRLKEREGVLKWRMTGSSGYKKLMRENNIPTSVNVDTRSSVFESDKNVKDLSNGVSAMAVKDKKARKNKLGDFAAMVLSDEDMRLNTVNNDGNTGAESVFDGICSSSMKTKQDSKCSSDIKNRTPNKAVEDAQLVFSRLRDQPGFNKNQKNNVIRAALSYAGLNYSDIHDNLTAIESVEFRVNVMKELIRTVRITGVDPRPSFLSEPEESDPKRAVKLLFSSDEISIAGEALNECTSQQGHHHHWKCKMMSTLMRVLPDEIRFFYVESPFCHLDFLYCLEHGGHCQKKAYIINGLPYRFAFRSLYGFEANQMMIVCRQRNPRYLLDFIRHGFDINSYGYLTQYDLQGTDTGFPVSMFAFLETMAQVDGANDDSVMVYCNQLKSLFSGFAKRLQIFCSKQMDATLSSTPFFSSLGCLTLVHTVRSQSHGESEFLTSLLGMQDAFYELKKSWADIQLVSFSDMDRNMLQTKQEVLVLSIYRVYFAHGLAYGTEYFDLGRSTVPDLAVLPLNEDTARIVKASLMVVETGVKFELTPFLKDTSSDQFHFTVPEDKIADLSATMCIISLVTEGAAGVHFIAQMQCIGNRPL